MRSASSSRASLTTASGSVGKLERNDEKYESILLVRAIQTERWGGNRISWSLTCFNVVWD